MQKLVDFVAEKNAEEFRNAFLNKISDVVVDVLENEKEEIARTMFTSLNDSSEED
jgi:hypothetical protein